MICEIFTNLLNDLVFIDRHNVHAVAHTAVARVGFVQKYTEFGIVAGRRFERERQSCPSSVETAEFFFRGKNLFSVYVHFGVIGYEIEKS